ncbi:MAG: class II aldolase/adducin family protein [Candidatus Electryonea clarkiae]|nr:class II aldolase/adducin family protein [Candidatus Electryonea clarkiae]MDP8288591.1 class II aldolase/adducin family protein [Candidatus Electryonea clarkiae]
MLSSNKAVVSMIKAGKRLDTKNLTVGTEGNLSVRINQTEIMITASNCCNGELTAGDFVTLNLDGEVINGTSKPSSEKEAHLVVYRSRSDVNAVIHAHPPNAIALTIAGKSLEAVPLPEAAYSFGSIPTCKFAVPGTDEGGRVVNKWIKERDALLLDHHGAITVGENLQQAMARMEMLESVAKIVWLYSQLGEDIKLGNENIKRIAKAALKAGTTKPEAILAWEKFLTEN